ncbi:MAG: FAD-binding oxidoreductase [Pseudomonadota bacterium]
MAIKKLYSRKDFLKLSAVLSAGLFTSIYSEANANQVIDSASGKADANKKSLEKSSSTTSVEFIRKDDAQYESLRKGFNKRINKFPLVIAMCSSTKDVVEAIQYANNNNLSVAVKSGGHSMEGFSCNNDGLVINLSRMNDVEFLDNHKIKVGPGCNLSQLYDQTLPRKRIIPAGTCGTVGIGGLTLGGGYGLFSRKYGLTCDSLLQATIVDGNGVVHSTKDDPELLWALRGGGAGNFGVATELVFQSYEAPDTVQAHHLKARKLTAERAKDLLEKWFAFAQNLPNSCFSGFVLNGGTLNILVTNFEPHTPELQLLLENLATAMDEFKSSPADEIAKKLKRYYGSLVPVYFKNSSAGFYRSFKDIESFITGALEKVVSTPGIIYQVNTLGGNIANSDFEKASSYPHRAYNFISELQAYWEVPTREEKLKTVSQEILKIFSSNGIKSQYINYCSLEFKDWQTAYYGKNYARLQEVKSRYDPNNVINHPQSIKS